MEYLVLIFFFFCLARTFATSARATASPRVAMMATAGVVSATALSYAYMQSKLV